jgi:hypothetical protein
VTFTETHELAPARALLTSRAVSWATDALADDDTTVLPGPEVARLGRTLRSWRAQILAYFDTHGLSNGGTEAINLLIEKARASPTATAASPTTDSACSSPRADNAPTGERPHHAQVRRAR